MRYCYAKWEPDPDGGRRARLPDLDNDSYAVLAQPGRNSEWALLRVRLADDERTEGLTPISDELDDLLISGEMYPPALALARDEVERHFKGPAVSHADFEKYYCERLRQHLAAQDTAGYLLARCLRDHTGYHRKGSYYWLIGYIPDRRAVQWVSSDYFVYTNPASDFDVPTQRLTLLSHRAATTDERGD